MRFSISGRKTAGPGPDAAPPSAKSSALTQVRVGAPRLARNLGRRDATLRYDRLFLPSLVIDHTELMLRQHGTVGEEGFGVWAGTLAAGDGFVSTLVIPRIETSGHFHWVVSEETTAAVLEELDLLDLVPLAQIHSHPHDAFLSPIDAERPIVAVKGFLSIIVPAFGFVDLGDVRLWRAYEFHGRDQWCELDEAERLRRLITDPSLLRLG